MVCSVFNSHIRTEALMAIHKYILKRDSLDLLPTSEIKKSKTQKLTRTQSSFMHTNTMYMFAQVDFFKFNHLGKYKTKSVCV